MKSTAITNIDRSVVVETIFGGGESSLYDLGNNFVEETSTDVRDEAFVNAHTPVSNYQVA